MWWASSMLRNLSGALVSSSIKSGSTELWVVVGGQGVKGSHQGTPRPSPCRLFFQSIRGDLAHWSGTESLWSFSETIISVAVKRCGSGGTWSTVCAQRLAWPGYKLSNQQVVAPPDSPRAWRIRGASSR
jgi:hypothetical protein